MDDRYGSVFKDRKDAGQQLAQRLAGVGGYEDAVFLALPRGGVPIAVEVAEAFSQPFDIIIVRKLGVPGREELAMGAVASGGVRVLNEDLIAQLNLTTEAIETVSRMETKELERREKVYRGGHPPVDVRGQKVVVVDDGIATGATMLAAIQLLRQQGAKHVIVAVPTAARDAADALRREADKVVVVIEPEIFGSVGRWYENFSQTTDAEVQKILESEFEER